MRNAKGMVHSLGIILVLTGAWNLAGWQRVVFVCGVAAILAGSSPCWQATRQTEESA